MKTKGKRFIAVSLLLAFVMLLGACKAKEDAVTPKESSGVTWAFSQDYGTLNYLISNKAVDSDDGFSHFTDTLIQNDKFSRLVPAVAKSWEVSADELTWTFKLRDDIMWVRYDGEDYEKLTAHDFVTGAKYILNPDNGSMIVDMMLEFVDGAAAYYADNSLGFDTVGVKAVDDFTLEYRLAAPAPFFDSVLTYATYLPVSQKFLDEIGIENFGLDKDKILYYGSYRLETWERDVERRLVKNDKYYDANRINVPWIYFFSVPDDVYGIELYKRGEVSSAGIGTTHLEEIMNDPEYKDYLYVSSVSSASWIWSFNLASTNPDFVNAAKNKNFRYAIFHSFDKRARLRLANPYDQEAINSGLYVPPELCVTAGGKDYTSFAKLPEYKERNRNNYDVAKAQEYMATAKEELGSSVSWPLTIRLLGTTNPTSERQIAVMKQLFEDAFPGDILVETVIYTSDTYYQIMEEGNYDFAQQGWSADYADPSNYLLQVLPGSYVDYFDFGSYEAIGEYERLLKEGMAITNDMDARYEKIAEAEGLLYEEMIVIPFSYNGGSYAINNIQNPYDSLKTMYGMSATKMHDRIYADEPLSAADREAQRVEFEEEKAALAAGN